MSKNDYTYLHEESRCTVELQCRQWRNITIRCQGTTTGILKLYSHVNKTPLFQVSAPSLEDNVIFIAN